ncbi:MAG: DNA-binding response regulator [bacterium]|nr:MAG: DNA-binding response regulator [bacterium]
MNIKVMIAFNNMLFATGVQYIIEKDNDIKIVELLKPGSTCTGERLETLDPNVILVDFTSLYNSFVIDGSETRNNFILVDTDCGRENIVSAILTKKISGVLLGDTTQQLLIKSIKAVSKGEVWIDKSTVKNLLFGINALKNNRTAKLTDKEKEVVNLISQGFTNKEVGKKLHISEPTVKTHLYRIFRKLDIKNRAQLVTYAIKNQDVNLVNF